MTPAESLGATGVDLRIESLISSAKKGSYEARGQLIEACQEDLLAAARRKLPSDLRAKLSPEDLAQETLLELFAGFDRFRGTTKSELMAWIHTVLRSKILTTVRSYRGTLKRDNGREVQMSGPYSSERETLISSRDVHDATSLAELRDDVDQMNSVLNLLPADYQVVIQTRVWEGLSYEEIGSRIGRTSEAARKLWNRAVDSLRAELHRRHGLETAAV